MHNKEVGKLEEEVPTDPVLKELALDIRFYAPYLLNGLQAFSEDQVSFYLKGAVNPIIFEASHERYSTSIFGYACFSNNWYYKWSCCCAITLN